VIQYCQNIRKKDLIVKSESVSRKRKGKREYLNGARTREMLPKLVTIDVTNDRVGVSFLGMISPPNPNTHIRLMHAKIKYLVKG